MKISTRLMLAVYVPALMALVIIAALGFSYLDMGKIQKNGDAVRVIRSSIAELNHFVFSYILYHEEMPKQQFLAENEVLMQLIANVQFRNSDQQRLLDSLRGDSVTMNDLFLQLVSYHESGSTAGTEEPRETEAHLVGLLLSMSYQADVDAAQLRSLIDDGLRITEIRTTYLILLVIVVATVPLTIVLARTRRGITSSLSYLSTGAAVIGSGDLDFKIEEKGNDEIGDVSRAFNRMAANLKTITATKDDLEREIDERKQAEKLLADNQQRLERSQELAHLGSWELDLVNNSLSWSDEVYRIFGLKPQEFTATYEAFLDAIHPEDRGAVDNAYTRSVADGRNSYEIEHRIVRKGTGETRYVFEKCEHIRDENGKIIRSIGMVQDITERKRAEEQLRQRTAELEASNRELEAFSYSVSHDLRAPLRSMEGFSSALIEDYSDKLDDQGKQYLKYVQESSDLMARLIDDLLKLSRVTRSDMIREEVKLSEIARKIVEELEKTEPHRHVRVSIAPDIIAHGDFNLLRIALENVLGNAWKFSSKVASPLIEMDTVEHNGRQAYFIRDNGVGFDIKYADKLFQPFQRLHKASEFPGTGIGLATVQRIIRRHGGEVWAESKVGEGAAFYFTLD